MIDPMKCPLLGDTSFPQSDMEGYFAKKESVCKINVEKMKKIRRNTKKTLHFYDLVV